MRPAGPEVVQRLEAEHPKLFAQALRSAAYLAYYENPAVVRAVRGLGQPYQAMPVPEGLSAARLRSRAATGRGTSGVRLHQTGDVKRLDLSVLNGGDAWPRMTSPPTS